MPDPLTQLLSPEPNLLQQYLNQAMAKEPFPTPTPAPVKSAGGMYRAMAYGPSQGEFHHDAMNGPLGPLRQNDIAISPHLEKLYPIGSYVDVVDKNGQVLLKRQRVADHSYDAKGPTRNTFEVWNGQDMGHANLQPSAEDTQDQIVQE